MNSRQEDDDLDQSLPGENAVPLLHRPLTQAEQAASDERREKQAEKQAEESYKQRQLTLAESANRATWTNIILTLVLAVFTAIGAGAAWYQGHVARLAAKASQDAADAAGKAAGAAAGTLTETIANNVRQEGLAEQARKDAIAAANASNAQSVNALQATIDNFRQEQRAWIAPKNAYFTMPPDSTDPIKFEIQYVNVGKQPAFAVRPTYTIKPVDKSEFDDGTFNSLIEADHPCKGKTVANGADVIYPTTPDGYTLQFGMPAWWHDDSLNTGARAMVIEMCFTYETMQEIHHTSFCYFYRKGVTKDRQMNICTAGNHAD